MVRMNISTKEQRNMQNRNEENENKCDFECCINHVDGCCMDKDARKECLEMAYAILCMGEDNEQR